jgi:hypothetical protein
MDQINLEKKISKMIEKVGVKPGEVVHVLVEHDADCPALMTQSLADCTCHPDFKKMREDA